MAAQEIRRGRRAKGNRAENKKWKVNLAGWNKKMKESRTEGILLRPRKMRRVYPGLHCPYLISFSINYSLLEYTSMYEPVPPAASSVLSHFVYYVKFLKTAEQTSTG